MGTTDYEELGNGYSAGAEITPPLITGHNSKIIQPRVLKAHELKKDRTRTRAEVFTPSWVCNAQNNLVDEQWFGGPQPFNTETDSGWQTIANPIPFPENSRSWKMWMQNGWNLR